jgi:iron complex outermembrane recepter protein
MNFSKSFRIPRYTSLALLLSAMVANAKADNDGAAHAAVSNERLATLDALEVVGKGTSYAKTIVSKEMLDRQFVMGSVNDALNEVPGVLVTEADAFGSSDGGTEISMRGFSASRSEIGTTIDGLPNGGSGYGGGSKANRYVDIVDLDTVEVSQGTADIASRSNEALGGTLNFLTGNPLDEQRTRVLAGFGDQNARKYYARYDTGLLGESTKGWASASHATNDDWIDGSGHTRRDHLSGKFESGLGDWKLSSYLSYDDADESEYDSITPEQFARDPEHDPKTGTLVGIPYIDQNFRSGSRAHRKNSFGYLRGRYDGGGGFSATVTGYAHRMRGRGDWLPPYLAEVTDDGKGNPESEYIGGHTVYGGNNADDNIYFVTPSGAAATMIANCNGNSNSLMPDRFNPSCYPAGSLPVQSYRHTHYANERDGITADAEWKHDFGALQNTVRGGLWLEKYGRDKTRDWHRLTQIGTSIAFDHTPYWVAFKDHYNTDEQMYYAEDVMRYDAFAWRMGVKQFFVDQTRDRRIGASTHVDRPHLDHPAEGTGSLRWLLAELRGAPARRA